MKRQQLTIIVADDSDADQHITRIALMQGLGGGIRLVQVATGQAAIEAVLAARAPACMLLDYRLPDMTAKDVLGTLCPERGIPPVAVVVMTVSDHPDIGREAVRAGATGFIGKEWLGPGSLARTLESAMERHALMVEQQRLNAQLIERTEHLRLALDGSGGGSFRHDLESDRVDWSDTLQRMMGYSPGGFGGTFADVLRHVHPEDAPRLRASVEQAIARCSSYEIQVRMVRVDGSVFWFEGRGSAFATRGESADTITGVGFDVTARKQLQDELAEREARIALAQRAAGLGLWDWDCVTNAATWNERTWELYAPGRPREAVTYELWLSCVHPDDRERAAHAVREAQEGGSYRDEFRVLDATRTRWLESLGEVMRDVGGRPQRMIGVVLDVTSRKNRELELRDSENRFRRMSETIPQIVYTCRPDGGCDWVNAYWHHYTGEKEFTELAWMRCLHPEDKERVLGYWMDRVASQEPFATEYRYRRADGTYGWHLSRAVPIRDADGTLAQWVGSSTDVTALREIADTREQMMSAERAARSVAEQANHVKDEFLAFLAHELRTPLSNILSWTHLMSLSPGDGDVLAKGISVLQDNARMQAKLIDDLLELNRASRAKMSIDRFPVRVLTLLESCVASHHATAQERGIELVLVHSLSLTDVAFMDEQRMLQVLNNLLTNALKFTPRAGRVTVSAQRAGDLIEILVADTGRGIHEDSLPHVFDLYKQSVASRRERGSLGLGLAIARQIVEMHEGTIAASSAGPGRGAVFTIRIPVGSSRPAEVVSPREPVASVAAALRGIHVIVVDDDPHALQFAAIALREHGATVSECGDGKSALAAVQAAVGKDARPILLTDIGMPRMDGYELLREVRLTLGLPSSHVPAIAMSAFARPEDLERMRREGFLGCMTKPFEASRLVDRIRAAGASPEELVPAPADPAA